MRIVPPKPTRQKIALATVFFACLPAHEKPHCQAADSLATAEEVLYSPIETDFRAEYRRDLKNQKVQEWAQYWGWVRKFYEGNLLSDGWTKHSEQTLATVSSDVELRKVLSRINDLGKLISREWAKDDRVRKINTIDLLRWSTVLRAARARDSGSELQIEQALKTVRAEAERRLRQ
jgi:hypothetical protein